MLSLSHFSVISLPHIDTIALILAREDYGSLHTERLKALKREFMQLIARTNTDYLVVDMDAVSHLGAAFLKVLLDCDRVLSQLGRRLVLCGDRHGVLDSARLSHQLNVQHNWYDAIAWCTQRTSRCEVSQVSSNQFAMV